MNHFCLKAGSSQIDITPDKPMFLYGYPHVARTSTGTHDPLLASALLLERDGQSCLFIAVDVIFVAKASTARIRQRLTAETGIPGASILLSATHTHSGPVTVSYLSNESDPVVPPVDPTYLRQLEDGIVRAGTEAWRSRRFAELTIVHADATGIGTCRHDPDGPADLSVPVLAARDLATGGYIGLLLVCAMHPTVLHEDSTLYSGDFPAFARRYLQSQLLGDTCPIIYHTGASGDQSPRHVTRGNTFAEAERLGTILGKAVAESLMRARFATEITLASNQQFVDLPARAAPRVDEAEAKLKYARTRLNALRGPGVSRAELRTAECDWFGAEETLSIARANEQGRLASALRTALPAEIQLLTVGNHTFIGWPGEFFVEFALDVKRDHPNSSIITLANGDLQGYVVTQKAIDNEWYEAGNAMLKSPEAGQIMVEKTKQMLQKIACEEPA